MIASLFFSLVMQAQAVPLQLTQQGRLLDGTGVAVTGAHTLTFIYMTRRPMELYCGPNL